MSEHEPVEGTPEQLAGELRLTSDVPEGQASGIEQAGEKPGLVTGHDFSRAERATGAIGALAPEGCFSGPSPVSPACFVAGEAQGESERHGVPVTAPASPDVPLFQSWEQPQYHPPERIPNFGHLAVFSALFFVGWLCAGLLTLAAIHFHLFGITEATQVETDIHYTLGSMTILYLVPFAACLLVFPMVWQKSFFAGLQWNGRTAMHRGWRLFGAAFVCFLLAMANGWLMPGPDNTPIDKIFRSPGAAWLLFGFGVTFAPFFEEIIFRGFLLPAICTAGDWIAERFANQPQSPLDWNGHPQWSVRAMVLGSILTSIPFALMHAEQTGHALGPFLLLFGVSMVLCWARLSTRSLAASVLVHASYNFLLFSLMLLGTGGFKHLDKM
jgi:membrane protease YdiL (CAAX protease family)